jgi:hypothetical protein
MIKTVVRTILLCFAIAMAGIGAASAAPNAASEYEVKAAFLYNFIKFVEWPPKAFPDRDSAIIIGVLGTDPFYDPVAGINLLEQTVNGKIINNRKIVVERSDRLANLTHCQLLFIPRSERSRIKDILASLRGMNILTVSETEYFCQFGGCINFVMQSEKVRFEINVGAAEKAELKISSKLLNVAKIVPTR